METKIPPLPPSENSLALSKTLDEAIHKIGKDYTDREDQWKEIESLTVIYEKQKREIQDIQEALYFSLEEKIISAIQLNEREYLTRLTAFIEEHQPEPKKEDKE